MKKHKSLLSILLSAIMVTSMVAAPVTAAAAGAGVTAYAAEEAGTLEGIQSVSVSDEVGAGGAPIGKNAALAKEAAPNKEASQAESNADKDTALDEEAIPNKDTVPGENTTPNEEATSGEDTTPDEEAAPDEDDAAEDETVLADEETAPADEEEITYPAEYFLSTPAETYNLWVGGVQVNSDNADNILSGTENDGKVSYDSTTHVLKLKNASITGNKNDGRGAGIYASSLEELVIETEGNNTVIGVHPYGSSQSVSGVKCDGTSLVFRGSGTLTVEQDNKDTTYGFYGIDTFTSDKTMTVESGTVIVHGQKSSKFSYGIHWYSGDLTVTGGRLIAQADAVKGADAIGIYTKNITVNGGALETSTGTGGTVSGIAISASGRIDVQSGSLTARSSNQAVKFDYGRDFTVGGNLDIAASTDGGESYVEYDADSLNTYNRIDVVPAYDLYVGGVRVNEANKGNISFAGTGTASYDSSTGVLKLKDAEITGKSSTDTRMSAGIYSEVTGGLVIETEGNNSIAGGAGGTNIVGIYARTSLTFCGNGTLEVTAYDTESANFIAIRGVGTYASHANITVISGTVIACGKEPAVGEAGYGIYISGYGDLTVTGGTLMAEGNAGQAISVAGDRIISDGMEISASVSGSDNPGAYDEAAFSTYKWLRISDTYPLYVGGVQVTRQNRNDVTGDGTVSYDPSTRVLKLHNAVINGKAENNAAKGAGIYTDVAGGLFIETTGNSTVAGAKCDNKCYGIYVAKYSRLLTLQGDGSLTAEAKSDGLNYAVFGEDGVNILLKGGTLRAYAGNVSSDASNGIVLTNLGELEVQADSELIVKVGEEETNAKNLTGISVGKLLVNGGRVSVTAQKTTGTSTFSHGIFAKATSDAIKIAGGTLCATGYTYAMNKEPYYGDYVGASIVAEWLDNGKWIYETGMEAITKYQYIGIGEAHNITVIGGTPSICETPCSQTVYGTTVTILADAPEEGKEFDCWNVTAGNITLKNAAAAETTFEMPDENVEIAASYMDSHTHAGVMQAGKAPTCTDAGMKAYYKCSVCGNAYEDEACTVRIADTAVWITAGNNGYIAPLGHDMSIFLFDEEQHWKKCSRCDVVSEKNAHAYAKPEDDGCKDCPYTRGLSISIAEDLTDCTYTGAAIKPAIIVRSYARVLTEGVDYTVTYKNNVNASKDAKPNKKPTIVVKGKGNFAGTTQKTFEIAQRSLADVTMGSIVVVKGSKAVPVLLYNGTKLSAKDYTNSDAAKKFTDSGSITVTGKGNYKDSITIPVTVVESKVNLKKFKAALGTEKPVYNGKEQKISYTVKDAATKAELTKGVDYEVLYTGDTVNAGTVKVSFVGLGVYTGSDVKKYTIKPCVAAAGSMKVTGVKETGYTYQPAGAAPGEELKVTYASGSGDVVLAPGRDYTVTCSGNKKVGDRAKYTVKFTGNYKGTKAVTGTYKITPAKLDNTTVKISVMDQLYKNKAGAYPSKPVVSAEGVLLKAADYTVNYYQDAEMTKEIKGRDNLITLTDTPVKVYVKITGKGCFGADSTIYASADYQVCPAKDMTDLGKAKVSFKDKDGNAASKFSYTGKEIKPEAVVQIKEGSTWKTLESAKYTVEYHNNVYKGKATVIVKANASGIVGGKSVKFSIVAENVSKLSELWKALF